VSTTPEAAPPASYATRDQAAAYVSRVLARRPPTSPAPVYLIAAPALMYAAPWSRLLGVLAKLLPGCELLAYRDVFTPAEQAAGIALEARLERITRAAGGAVVVPSTTRPDEHGRRLYRLGYAARLEAEGVLAAGRPVLVLAPGGLVAWPDVRVHAATGRHSIFAPLELDMPEAPPRGVVLPTVAASYRALGLGRPKPWRPPRPPRSPPRPSGEAGRTGTTR
jgi:hypothetical protein